MAPTARAGEQLDQIKALTNDVFVSIEAVIRDDNQRSLRSQRSLLNCRPDTT